MITGKHIGKAKVEFNVRGCMGCGTEFSSGWRVVRHVTIVIDNGRPIELDVHQCADCDKQADCQMPLLENA